MDKQQSAIVNKACSVAVAVIYGAALSVAAGFLAGAGHGSYLLCGVFSAPAGLFGYRVAFISIVGLWTAAGILLTLAGKTARRRGVAVLLSVHYIGIPLLLLTKCDAYVNLAVLHEQWNVPVFRFSLVLSMLVYLVGQVWLVRRSALN